MCEDDPFAFGCDVCQVAVSDRYKELVANVRIRLISIFFSVFAINLDNKRILVDANI